MDQELYEAAKIDGLTHGQIYWMIILRLAAPILSVVALLSFISTFGEFVIARVVLQQEQNWTVAIGLYSWVASQLDANWGQFAAGAIIASVPILILFLFLQTPPARQCRHRLLCVARLQCDKISYNQESRSCGRSRR